MDQTAWLAQRLLEDNATAYHAVWDLYLQFYTVFLTFSIAALALTVQYVSKSHRPVIVWAFVAQNLISGVTAVLIARFSEDSASRYERLAAVYASRDPNLNSTEALNLAVSPIPGVLGEWGGYANAASHGLLIVCWLSLLGRPRAPS
jgi:hypothetical protein